MDGTIPLRLLRLLEHLQMAAEWVLLPFHFVFVFSISIFVFCISVLILSPLSRGPTVGNDWVLVGSMGPSVTKSRSLLNLLRRKIPRKGQSMDPEYRNLYLKWSNKMVQRDSASFITRPSSMCDIFWFLWISIYVFFVLFVCAFSVCISSCVMCSAHNENWASEDRWLRHVWAREESRGAGMASYTLHNLWDLCNNIEHSSQIAYISACMHGWMIHTRDG